MGSHGNPGLNEILIGSSAQKMIRYSKVPVMVVKNDTISPSFNKVVYTSDFKEDNLNDSLSCVKSIVEFYKANLHLFYINTPNRFEDSHILH